MDKFKMFLASTFVLVLFSTASLLQADVTFVSTSVDVRGALTSADLGVSVDGTLFWDYSNGPQDDRNPASVANNLRDNLPGSISFGGGADLEGTSGGWGYQQIMDDFGGPFESGTLASGVGPELAVLTVNGISSFRLGVYMDNLDGTTFIGNDLTVSGPSASASIDPSGAANLSADIHWFDISNLTNGDTISIQTSGASSGISTVSGFVVTNVTAIPEPSGACVVLLSMFVVSRRQRKC